MKLKLDENVPQSAGAVLRGAGHEVDTVADEDLSGATDLAVSAAATRAGRLVLTLDRGFGDVRTYPPGAHSGILVLRVEDQSPSAILREIRHLAEHVDLDTLVGAVAVYRAGDLRVRRPTA